MIEEATLIHQYQTQVDQLYRQMNPQLFYELYRLGQQSQNDITLQIIGSLMSSYIDLNHQNIPEYDQIFQGVFQIIVKSTSNVNPVYHFLGSILANILFHYQDKLPPNYFAQHIQELLIKKPLAAFTVLETVIKRLTPTHKLHKQAIITLDSQHRAVKNQFYKNNLDLLLNSIMVILKNNYYELIERAISLFILILEGEFVTDTKEKDFHKLRRGDVKNNRSLEVQLSKYTPSLIEEEIQKLMIVNSTIQWVDPTRSSIKRLWANIMDIEFIALLIQLLPTYQPLWGVLSKICKIFKKHFRQDQKALELIRVMTGEIRKLDCSNLDLINLLKFASRSLYADPSEEWIMFNVSLFSQATKISQQVQVFRFLREMCRYLRQQQGYNKEQISGYFMQVISSFFINWVFGNQEVLLSEPQYYQNIRYNIKVIAAFIPHQYLSLFSQIIAENLGNQQLVTLAYDFYLIGLKSCIYSTSYQIDVQNKVRYFPMDQILYQFDLTSFNQFDYISFFAQQIEIAWKINDYLLQNQIQTKFWYHFYQYVFDSDLMIRFEQILKLIPIQRSSFFDFSLLLNMSNQDFLKKCLNIINKAKFRFELVENEFICTINNVMVPKECLAIFDHFSLIRDSEILELYYGIKSQIYNSQNEAFYSSEDSELLLNKFVGGLKQLVSSIPDTQQVIYLFKSLLTSNGRFTYLQIMNMMWEQKRFEQYIQFLTPQNHLMLSFTKQMINPDAVAYLRSEIVDELYEWIHTLSKYYLTWLIAHNSEFNQERQLGEKSEKKIYQIYYRPIRKLLKLFLRVKCMRKCLTSKVKVRQAIQQLIFKLLHLINLNDLNVLIHKMEPLYSICEWLIDCETRVEDHFVILEFVDRAIRIQERLTFSSAIRIFESNMRKTENLQKNQVQVAQTLESLLIAAYIYNQRVADIGKIVYNYLKMNPLVFDCLFISIRDKVGIEKSSLWHQQYSQKVQILKVQDKQEQFVNAFVQLQMLYNYLQ